MSTQPIDPKFELEQINESLELVNDVQREVHFLWLSFDAYIGKEQPYEWPEYLKVIHRLNELAFEIEPLLQALKAKLKN